jgi:hypothetical protein
MGIFRRPDFEQMRRDGELPRLINWALYDKDRESSRAALASLRKDVPVLVEYLYETATWAQAHNVGRRKMLPSRSVKLLDEAVQVLTRLGGHTVTPLVDAVRVYDDYGSPDEHARFLFFVLVFEALEKIGRPAVVGLQELAGDPQKDVAKQAREVLARLDARGLVADEDDERDEEAEEEDEPEADAD